MLLFINSFLFVSLALCSEEDSKIQGTPKLLKSSTEGITSIVHDEENKENVPHPVNQLISKSTQAGKSIKTSEQPAFPYYEIEYIYEAFGGYCEIGSWALTSRPTMKSLADCASKGNPIALLYLAHSFRHKQPATKECWMTEVLYNRAFQALKKVANQTEDRDAADKAKYIIAKDAQSPYYLIPDDQMIGIKDFSIGYLTGLTTREAVLLSKLISVRNDIEPRPSIDEFLHEEDLKLHPGIFLHALGFMGLDYGDQVKALEKAIQKYEHPAFIMQLARIYRIYYERGKNPLDNVKSIELLERAGKLGQPLGYIRQVGYIVRPAPTLYGDFYFGEATDSDLEKCKELLLKATALKMPDAFLNYAIFLEEIYNRTPKENIAEKQRLHDEYIDIHKQAAQLGCLQSYNVLFQVLSSDDKFFDDYPEPHKEREQLFVQVMNSEQTPK